MGFTLSVGSLLVTAHLLTDIGQPPLGGVHHLAQSVAMLAHALNQVVIDGDGLLIATAPPHIVHDEIVAGVVALILHGLPRGINGVGPQEIPALQAAGGQRPILASKDAIFANAMRRSISCWFGAAPQRVPSIVSCRLRSLVFRALS